MTDFKVVSTSTVPIVFDREGFVKLGVDLIEKPSPTEDEVISLARDADVLIVMDEPLTKRVISHLKSCRLIFTGKAGYDNIDVAAATEAGICVANISGYSSDEVSDHVMALLLTFARRIVGLNKMVREGQWHIFHGPEMQKMWKGTSRIRWKALGLIGFGAIARVLTSKASGLGLRVLAYDPYVPADDMKKMGVEPVGLDRLLGESDFVSLHVPLTPETRHMLGLEQFKLMKPTAYLINTSRGKVVDEEALYTALTRGYIAGAGLDVLETEPVRMDNPLLKLDSVLFTGHSAHYSDQVWTEVSRRPAEEVGRIMAGEWPLGWLNPQVEAKFIKRWRKSKAVA